MATVFSRIIAGELPGRFAYADEECVVFSTIEPIAPGHMLVVPRQEIAAFTDAPDDLLGHLMVVAKHVGLAQQAVFPGTRAVMMVAGFDVPHVHLHVFSLADQTRMSFANANPADAASLDSDCEAVRGGLRDLGFGDFVPATMDRPSL